MNHQRERYLEIKIRNSSKEDRLIMIYDALVQYLEEAEGCLSMKPSPADKARAATLVCWSIDILAELTTVLRYNHNPQLCRELSALYRFFTQEISGALSEGKSDRIANVLRLVTDLRDTWVQAKESLAQPMAEVA